MGFCRPSLANMAGLIEYNAIDESWLGGTYTLAQNGITLDTMPCGGEYDLFLTPKGPLNYLGPLAAAAPNGFTSSAPLSNLTSLYFHAGVNILSEIVTNKCQNPPINQVGYGMGIFLRNINNNTTFFYQIIFRSSVPGSQTSNGYYEGFGDAGGNVGVGDHVSNIAPNIIPPSPGGGRVAFSAVNIFPRMKQIISQGWAYNGAGPNKVYFDSNMSHWRIDGLFAGQFLWGGVYAESKWDNIRLQAFP